MRTQMVARDGGCLIQGSPLRSPHSHTRTHLKFLGMDRKIRLGFLYDRKSWIGDAKEPVRICCQIGLSEKLLTGLMSLMNC